MAYIPSEKLAIESGSADENIEIMKAYMCKQRGIRLIKLPMKGSELDYANSLKKAFQSVHKTGDFGCAFHTPFYGTNCISDQLHTYTAYGTIIKNSGTVPEK